MSDLTPAAPGIVLRPTDRTPAQYTDADYTISADTAGRLLEATPENTRRAYDRNWSQFVTWCEALGRVPLPATPHTLTAYVDRLILIEFAPATIEQIIGTIRSKHSDKGYDEQPDTRETLKLMRAYKHQWADAGGRRRKAKPILIDALRAMVATCDPGTPAGQRDRALLLLGLNAMCRRSEISGLDLRDLEEQDDGESADLFIRYSKTDQDVKGSQVNIPIGEHPDTCAIRTTQTWAATLAGRGITEGALFRPVDRHGHIGGEDSKAGTPAERLTGDGVSGIVRRRARLAGLKEPEKYSGHSLRSGGATSAYMNGAPVSEIAIHGRWAENSPVVLGYIRAVDGRRHNPMKGIGL